MTLPTIPITIPDVFEGDHAKYREWLSLRVSTQMLASIIQDKSTQKSTITILIKSISNRAKLIPAADIPFPADLMGYQHGLDKTVAIDPKELVIRVRRL